MIHSFFTIGSNLAKPKRFYNAGLLERAPQAENDPEKITKQTKELEDLIKGNKITTDSIQGNDEIKMAIINSYGNLSATGKLKINEILIKSVQERAPNHKGPSTTFAEAFTMSGIYEVANMKPENLTVKVEKHSSTAGLIKFGGDTTPDKPNPTLLHLPVDVAAFRQEQTEKIMNKAKQYSSIQEEKPSVPKID